MFFQKTQFWADCLAERQPLAACFLTHAYSFIPEVLQFLVIQLFEPASVIEVLPYDYTTW